MPKFGRTKIAAAMAAVLVLATLAVAVAAARNGGDGDEFQVNSAEPSVEAPAGTGSNASSSGIDPTSEPSELPAASAQAPNPSPPAGPDTPVSSGDTQRPQPTAVGDPSSAFSGIRTFEDCAAAGYPVAESYPEQCRTPDGRLFVRDVGY